MTAVALGRADTAYNRVPKVTVDFWLIKLMAVTVGETAADYMNLDLELGLVKTAWILSGLLIVALTVQFAQKRYVPWSYWISVVLISIVGTLITDNLEKMGVSFLTSTILFSLLLAVTFAIWHGFERTLSIHSIYTTRREVFYWLAILFTFALGTAAGDLGAEIIGLGFVYTGLVFGTVIAVIAAVYYAGWMNGILAFWLAYILTRPLGACLGDFLSQGHKYGGLGFGTVITSYIFLGCIAAVVLYMTMTRDGEEIAQKDALEKKAIQEAQEA